VTDELGGYLELTDWRRRVAVMWEAWRSEAGADPVAAAERFRAHKDELFREHPQTPLLQADRPGFSALPYWPYDAAYRMEVTLEPDAPGTGPTPLGGGSGAIAMPSSGEEAIRFRRIGRVELGGPLAGQSLSVFWIDAYGGGIFLPFRDTTSGSETYGAGRYLLDTIKSADHGGDHAAGTVLLDFNMAFHPSCAYDPKWSCPLAPPENRLDVPVRVGERLPR